MAVVFGLAPAAATCGQEWSGIETGVASPTGEGSTQTASAGQLSMLRLLQQRVESKPDHSESWRSLGRLQGAMGDKTGALASAMRAVDVDSFNAAAHFDVGQLLVGMGRVKEANSHFNRVYEIAPTSSYASQLSQQGYANPQANTAKLEMPLMIKNPTDGSELPDPNSAFALPANSSPAAGAGQSVSPVGYQIQSFDGSDDLEQRLIQLEGETQTPLRRLRVFLETGVLYNSNVTLTPVSRELAQDNSGSFQAFASPDLDWKWVRTENTRLGPMFRGYFTANESTFKQFNVASFQPGAFVERDFKLGQSEAIGRMEYIFSYDLFDGKQVDDRHAVTASLTLIRPDLDAIYSYLTVAQSNFLDDGVLPSQTSLDGTTITAGTSRFFPDRPRPSADVLARFGP